MTDDIVIEGTPVDDARNSNSSIDARNSNSSTDARNPNSSTDARRPNSNGDDQVAASGKHGRKPSGKGGHSIIPSLKIRGRLNAGFGAVCLVLVVLVAVTVYEITGVATINKRIVDLRVPTSAASLGLVNDINASLAALRGWMITGNPSFKTGRAAVWADIAKVQADMDRLSASWTNPKNVAVWKGFKVTLDEFRIAQEKVEAIARSPEEHPATKILTVEAAPKANIMVGEITKIINQEASMPATAERKALLGMMADVRGTTARALANIRAFLLTGNPVFQDRFNTMWTKNIKRFADLKANRVQLNPAQRASFDKLDAARTAFLPLPERMFSIRGSKKWNMANYLLVTEAAPRAGKLLTILVGAKLADGTRAGGMVANQKGLLNKDAATASASIAQLNMLEWILLAIGLVIAIVIAFVTARSIVNPIASLTGSMTRLAGGDKQSQIPARDRNDEVGSMAAAVQVFKENMIETERLQAEQAEAEKRAAGEEQRREEDKRAAEAKADQEARAAEARAEEERKQGMLDMADAFEKSVMGVVEAVASGASQMQSSAQTMSATANQTSQQATAVAAASQQATANVQTVASSAEELSSSVEEISRQVSQSNQIAQDAVEEAKQTNTKVEGLAEAAQKIGEVVDLINDIASQTNLLALNATIEAARAGDAGKGFAVVASEVKSLATQTGKATEEIAAQITGIQGATTEAVQDIQGIGTTIGKMGEISISISSAVEEQGAATREIAGSVTQAAQGTQEVSENITEVTKAATQSQEVSGQMLEAANGLAEQGEVLRKEVDKFLQTVRAA